MGKAVKPPPPVLAVRAKGLTVYSGRRLERLELLQSWAQAVVPLLMLMLEHSPQLPPGPRPVPAQLLPLGGYR